MDHVNSFSSNSQNAENNRLKKRVGQNFVIIYIWFGPADQQINLVLPKILSLKSVHNSWGNSYIPCL